MKRTARDKRDLPHPKPVERIELNEENTKRRLLLAVIFLLIGAAGIGYGVWQLMTPQTDWITVEAQSGEGATCGDDFVFLYRLGGGELSPAAERKAVTAAYGQLCRDAYELFHSQEEFAGVNNLRTINRKPNQELTVDKGLYDALAAVERSGNRAVYLGPVYDQYENIFYSVDDVQLMDFDPLLNEEIARSYREYAAYASDPQSVQLELLGGNKVRLSVSEEYLAYAQREGIVTFIDFSWMRNAFIADYLADGLEAQGYVHGALSSFDGYVRNLDGTGTEYSLQLYGLLGSTVYPAALLNYQGPMSIVSLRDYPVSEADWAWFYELRNGEMRVPYLDPADGMPRAAVHELTCYAPDMGCAEIVLEAAAVYVADDFAADAPDRLAAAGIQSIYCEGSVIRPSDAGAELVQLFEGEGARYTVSRAK